MPIMLSALLLNAIKKDFALFLARYIKTERILIHLL